MKKLIAVIPLLLLLLLLSGCNDSFSAIDRNEVEKIIIWFNVQSKRELSEDEIIQIIDLYNASEYGGKATGEGGTPDFGLRIILNNNNEIRVNDFNSKVEVMVQNKTFYLESESLYNTIKDIASGLQE